MIKHAIILSVFLSYWTIGLAQSIVFVDELNLSHAEQDDYPIMAGKNVKGNAIKLNHTTFTRGIGTYTNSMLHINLHKGALKFNAIVGFDDEVLGQGCHPIEFIVYADDTIAWQSGIMLPSDVPKNVDIDVKGVSMLSLYVKSVRGKWNGYSAWANARFEVAGARPEAFIREKEAEYLLTPKTPEKAQINGATIMGVRPNAPFQYYIPVSGNRPIKYEVENLPTGLLLDKNSGIITGKITQPGTYNIVLKATNIKAASTKTFTIVVGDTIALTPPMGWSSWNVWAENVSQGKVKMAADAIKNSGLINFGWTYINIDDSWQGSKRGGKYNALQANEKFPDMGRLCNYIHSLGLKAGIYSTPWEKSYAQFPGSSADCADGTSPYYDPKAYRIEFGFFPFYQADANQWADWGFDYLKLDWFPNTVSHTIEFEKAIKKTGRDMVYSISNAAPISQAEYWKSHCNLWRTTGDIVDSWGSVYAITKEQEQWNAYGGPGHWNDPDMLVVGWLGWGKALHNTKLTPTEQYAHISLWSLMSAPLLIGADLTQLNEFTFNLLSNNEVIAIDQDRLGKMPKRIKKADLLEVWVKDLSDGTKVVGLCNFGILKHSIRLNWDDLGIDGNYMLRDVWKQKDIGVFSNYFESEVNTHGVTLIKLRKQ